MKKIILFLLLKLNFITFSQTSSYLKIENVTVQKNFQILDTLSMNEISKFHWNNSNEIVKEKTRQIIRGQKRMIKADTLFLTKIYYLGKIDSIELKPLNVFFVKTKSSFEYEDQSLIENDSIFKKKLGYTNRYIGKRKFILYFRKKKRYALIELDTNYSEIYLDAENIKSKDFYSNKKRNSISDLNSSHKQIEVDLIPEEKIIIDHRIPLLIKKH